MLNITKIHPDDLNKNTNDNIRYNKFKCIFFTQYISNIFEYM